MWLFGYNSDVGSAIQVFTEDKASHLLLLGAKLSDGTDNAQAPGSQFKHTSAVYLLITTVRFSTYQHQNIFVTWTSETAMW